MEVSEKALHSFTVLILTRVSGERSNFLQDQGSMDTERDEKSEESGDEAVEGGTGGATELNVITSTDHKGHVPMYSA